MTPRKVLDAWALLAWLGGEEPAAETVHSLLQASERRELSLHVSTVNLGEVYYMIAKTAGKDTAVSTRNQLASLPVQSESALDGRVREAAELKATYSISYADAFAAALAMELACPLVTGDPDFAPIVDGIGLQVLWLSRSESEP